MVAKDYFVAAAAAKHEAVRTIRLELTFSGNSFLRFFQSRDNLENSGKLKKGTVYPDM